jgi:cytosine/adenosine deaminase-related metal-dependent hydrolase
MMMEKFESRKKVETKGRMERRRAKKLIARARGKRRASVAGAPFFRFFARALFSSVGGADSAKTQLRQNGEEGEEKKVFRH